MKASMLLFIALILVLCSCLLAYPAELSEKNPGLYEDFENLFRGNVEYNARFKRRILSYGRCAKGYLSFFYRCVTCQLYKGLTGRDCKDRD
ncbi:hypothetical protein B5X24_HaOG215149 [Helicoverpa armigera]|nr:hypothetical protein B5X24_HaOG215149 [Helicoverpa armigera]